MLGQAHCDYGQKLGFVNHFVWRSWRVGNGVKLRFSLRRANGGASRAGRVRGSAFARKQTESALSHRFTRAIARSRACAGWTPAALPMTQRPGWEDTLRNSPLARRQPAHEETPPLAKLRCARTRSVPAHGATPFSPREAVLSGHDAPAVVFKEPCI